MGKRISFSKYKLVFMMLIMIVAVLVPSTYTAAKTAKGKLKSITVKKSVTCSADTNRS